MSLLDWGVLVFYLLAVAGILNMGVFLKAGGVFLTSLTGMTDPNSVNIVMTILIGLVIWMVIVTAALFLPEGNVAMFLLLGVAIGVVLGGTQALARSYFSLLIPRGKEAEYFSLYQACERGTSWLGTLVFGLVHQWADSYRPAIFALIVFFVVGGLLLWRVDPRRGIADAGKAQPAGV